MRRASALLAIPLLALAAVAGCGSSAPNATGRVPLPANSSGASTSVSVSGAFDKAPQVSIPSEPASSSLYSKTVIKGTGPTVTSAESFVGNYAAYIWSGTKHKLAASTYTSGTPSVFSGQLLPGLSTALKGATVGSRVVAVIPPKDGFGPQGNSQLGVKGSDTLVFVIDLVKAFSNSATGTHVSDGGGSLPTVSTPAAGQAPTVTIPKTPAPKNLTVTTLLKGSGAKVAKGQTVIVQYTGVNYRTGKVFDSSWSRGQPFEFKLDAKPEQVIPGWDKGLTGQPIGSRLMLTIPPSDGYGKKGSSQAGIKGTDTLVFVVDILGTVS